MTRKVAENTNSLSVFYLKKHGYLPQKESYTRGRIIWTYEHEDEENSMGFLVKTGNIGGYVELIYTNTNYQSGEETDMRYKVPLVITPCNYGGRRYWFLCPLSSHEMPCKKRVAVMYGVGKWFGCRHCANVAYRAQFEGGDLRVGSNTEQKVQKAYAEVRREYYGGKPTRKYKRYMCLRKKKDELTSMLIGKL